ncbi:MAG TPA: DNA polymerase III subunit delta [Dehalococcoidia bacterium]|nr:DNA polymerase III subunit delta [Dehalococcoidia bacterium]
MIYAFYGPDQFRARDALQTLRAELDTDGALAMNTERIEGKTVTPGELRAACHTASFFAESRLVIIEGLMSRFAGSRRRGARRARSTEAATSDFDAFVEVLSDLPPSTTVAMLDEQAGGFVEALGDKVTAREFRILKGDEVRRWTAERAKAQGARLAPAALDRLASLIDGSHLGELAQEIDKLVTYAGDRAIETADVDELVSGAVQFQTWDLTDAVIEGRGDRAMAVLQAMGERDYAPQLLIFMLTRQYRQLLLAQSLLREGMGADQIGAQLGLAGYPLKKTIDQASRYAADKLEAAYRRLFETDVAVKTGVLDVSVALEMLVAELAELGRRGGRAAAPMQRGRG